MFGLFKSEDEKIFESFQKQINKTDLLENNALQIAIIDRVHTHYQNSLIQVKEKKYNEAKLYFGAQALYFKKKCDALYAKKIEEELEVCLFIECCILEGLYQCLYGTSDTIKLKASNYFIDYVAIKLVEKGFYLDEINEYNEVMMNSY